ncbi:MAG: bacteriocin-protection protein, partial [Actinomycetota bacterium]
MPSPAEPIFFRTPAAFRAWLERHHADRAEVVVGFHKKASGKPSMTWPEAVDEALCFGWIDGVRRTLDATSYATRFTPRQARSTWSAINVAKVEALIAEDRMTPAGLAAFERRDPGRTAIYSHEQRGAAELEPAM